MSDATFWTELGKSGPWALVAGFLLYTVINAWKEDRTKVLPFFQNLHTVLTGLESAVNANTESNKAIAEGQRDMLDLLKEIKLDGRSAGRH